MPNNLILVLAVELALIVLTTLFLFQPKSLFGIKLDRMKMTFRWGGLLLLCVTFFWSIIIGIILSMNNLTIRL